MVSPRILVVDDEADLRELVEITLVRMGLDVDSAESLEVARRHLAKREYALVLTDMRLPDGLGIELVQEITASYKNTPVAVITAFGSADNAVMALKAGAFDYLSKPVGLEQLRAMVQSALRTSAEAVGGMPVGAPPAAARNGALRLRGHSPVMQDLRSQIVRLARSMAPVAITGESGSGKELAARDIHALSARADKPFIAVNCGAIVESLMEAEFFGYRKGAFTGATDDREGFFQAANGGTLLLDEVADLPLAMQVKLLRAIQERRVRKVGATTEEPVDVRLISATHQNLAACVEQGRFRQDLYYRLNVIELNLPPLRDRREDIELLADAILDRLAEGNARTVLSAQALEALQQHGFPGNVRELENILERALAFSNGGVIEAADLALRGGIASLVNVAENASMTEKAEPQVAIAPAAAPAGTILSSPAQAMSSPIPTMRQTTLPTSSSKDGSSTADTGTDEENSISAQAGAQTDPSPIPALPLCLTDYLDEVECRIIRRALEHTRFNRTAAAELLGLSFRQLRYRMQRLDIQEPH